MLSCHLLHVVFSLVEAETSLTFTSFLDNPDPSFTEDLPHSWKIRTLVLPKIYLIPEKSRPYFYRRFTSFLKNPDPSFTEDLP